jgi:alpha-amylase/alpha-mannosidase (GH57 family)
MNRYLCIHGHFYQPPRENPWLEVVEVQDSAYPFHDWNQRVSDECYAPNSASRILDSEKNIVDIVNNYARMSFNFGPTLLSWLEKNEPEVYRAIIEADKESQQRFSGHGSAIAQAYNHFIMPLADSRDRRTQVVWGIKDFKYRFQREPEGMWLPETAVDLETLDIMAEQGIKLTILAPTQAKRVRRIGDKGWEIIRDGKIDPKLPYLCQLPSGRMIVIFFFDKPISKDIAFGDLLESGELLARRLTEAFTEKQTKAQLVHVASDGESYGHHHRFGDMALAYCLHEIESKKLAALTVYGEYLEKFPPEYEVEIVENSSWSCAHGIERWKSNCGCSTGRNPGWTQEWRAPLREAMDWLRSKLITLYEEKMGRYLKDPWKAREDYIEVMLDRSEEKVESLFSKHTSRQLSPAKKIEAIKLLEIERNAMLMYTSCGWFFDEITRLEPVQVMQYAARAMQLAREVGERDFEPDYIRILEKAPSNVPGFENGADVYQKLVKPAVLDLLRIGVHYAVSSLFESYPEVIKIGSYTATSEIYDLKESAGQRLAVGKARLHSDIIGEEDFLSFAVLYLGDHNLIGGVRQFMSDESFSEMLGEIKKAFTKNDIPELVRLMDKHFGTHSYSLWHLFREEKRKVLNQILDSKLKSIEASFRQIYERNYAIMQGMKENQIPLPKAFLTTAEFILHTDFRRLMEEEVLDLERLKKLIAEFKQWAINPDKTFLGFVATQRIDTLLEELSRNPEDLALWETINHFLLVLRDFPLELNLWKSQNIYFALCKKHQAGIQERDKQRDPLAIRLLEEMNNLGSQLKVKCG